MISSLNDISFLIEIDHCVLPIFLFLSPVLVGVLFFPAQNTSGELAEKVSIVIISRLKNSYFNRLHIIVPILITSNTVVPISITRITFVPILINEMQLFPFYNTSIINRKTLQPLVSTPKERLNFIHLMM